MFRSLIVAAVLVIPGAALADKADADACAAGISPQGRIIYRQAVGYVQRGATLEDAMRRVLKPKVDGGRMSEAEARKYGREAGNCARLVHRRA
jgi:hypothetical protein